MSTCNGSGWCQLWGWPELPLYTALQSLFLQLSWKPESTLWYSWDNWGCQAIDFLCQRKNMLTLLIPWICSLSLIRDLWCFISALRDWFYFQLFVFNHCNSIWSDSFSRQSSIIFTFLFLFTIFYKSCNISKHLGSHKIYHQMAEHFLIGFSSFFLLRTCVCVCTQVQYEQVDCVRTQEP